MANENPLERYTRRMWELAETDPQIKAMKPKAEVREAILKPGLSLADIISTVLTGYGPRPALAERTYEIKPDPETGRQARHYLPEYSSITYRELQSRIEAVACAFLHHPNHKIGVDEYISILGFSGIDYAVIDFACTYIQAVDVPLQSSLAGMELERIIENTESVTIAATIKDLELAATLAIGNGNVRSLIVFEYDPRVDEERGIFEAVQARLNKAGAGVKLTTVNDLIDFGSQYTWKPLPHHPDGLERPDLIMHSSGSTGAPKGAIIPERMAKHAWIGGVGQAIVPVVGMGFAPMNHFMGRYAIFNTMTAGGTCYFTVKPDLSTIFEDVRLARPTFMTFFPRIFELIYQYYQSEVARRLDEGLGGLETVDAQVRMEMHDSFLGDRLRGGSIGSAPISPEIKDFVRECFDIMLVEGYGSTEGGIVITTEGRIMRPPVIDYKLRDVPELGYYSTDKPYSRGELCVKSELQFVGYFKRPEATAAVLDEEGYVCTGDIMEERGPDHIVYIDRRNDVLKLSNAEFVAVGPLGALFEGSSAVIHQMYIYGNSARSYLLGVIVPDMGVVETMIGPNPDAGELKALIRSEMMEVGRIKKLRTFEIPRDFIIEMEPFSHENGLLSSVRKRMRPKFREKYGERLEALYEELERKRREELMALKNPDSPLSTTEKVAKILEATLGVEKVDPWTDLNFSGLGGDSLASVSFAMFIEDIFGVPIPVNAIVSPAGNPERWAKAIETALGGGAATPSFASIHGPEAAVLHGRDLHIDRFYDKLDNVPADKPPVESRTVLLTGANGFLGRFNCLAWLEQLAKNGGRLICLVRAASNEAARKRLDAVFEGVDPALEKHYHTLADKHLEVLASDIAEPGLGLPQADWDRLAAEVDRIVHPAALVNHRLPYEHLFAPNVYGTAELIRLALTNRMKRFDFVSSQAVGLLVDTSEVNSEDSPLLESIPIAEHYAAGYGASKWANEVMLHSAHQRYGLPVNIFRCDMIMPHSRYRGQINVTDMITRLLFSLVMTGLVPKSFYKLDQHGNRQQAHYDGLPVDFIAGAMLGITTQSNDGLRTFNVSNHHEDDSISLDSFADWVESAGYRVERVADHKQWVERIESKLGNLTESQRQHSMLEIMGFINTPHPPHEPLAGSAHFQAEVRKLAVGPAVPHLTEAYIHKYLNDMHLLGLIPEPKTIVPAAREKRAY